MEAELLEVLQRRLHSYDLNIYQWDQINENEIHLESSTGSFRSRIMEMSAAKASAIVGDWASAQGIRRIERQLQNRYGERQIPLIQEKVLIVSTLWKGLPLQVDTVDVAEAASTLAHLHQAMEGCEEALGPLADSLEDHTGIWLSRMKQGVRKFETEKKLHSERQIAPSEDWGAWLERWLDLATEATTVLEQLGYEQWVRSRETGPEISWSGFRLKSLSRLEEGLGIHQPLVPVRDSPLYDLITLCLDIADSGYTDGVLEAIETYREIRPVSDREAAMVVAFISFPHEGLRTLYRYRQQTLQPNIDATWRNRANSQFSAGKDLLQRISDWRRGNS